MPSLQFTNKAQAQAWVKAQSAKLKRPAVVLLSGSLGAGKTQFVRWFLEEFKAKDVASPTFAIHHEYQTPSGAIDHVDLYRLKDDSDLEGVGFWDLFTQPQGLVFVEWADRLSQDVWPTHWQQLHLQLSVEVEEAEARRLDFDFRQPSPKGAPAP
jgi:tRNA threonylcarbamoyladenosine biosynthesis protein TsaE